MARKSEVRTKKDALGLVAKRMAGELHAMDISDLLGDQTVVDSLTNAEATRITWAMDEVQRRLYGMVPSSARDISLAGDEPEEDALTGDELPEEDEDE